MIDFTLTKSQASMKDMLHEFAKGVVRPLSLKADQEHKIPDEFLRRFSQMRA